MRRRQAPIVTLTTDFGLRDPYVAEVKAAILSIAREVHLVDITHEIAAHDVVEAALALESAVPSFPDGTIHLAVVDPGVGTDRRGLVVEAGGQRFVGPDNGIFTAFLAGSAWRAFELTAPGLRRASVSATFHGRDVFGPAAGHLAHGVPAVRFGPRIADPVKLDLLDRRHVAGRVEGVVVHVDRFGNLVTSIRADDCPGDGTIDVRIAGRRLPLVMTYGDLRPRRAGALLGSHGRLEIAVREGSAAERFRARRGAKVVVSRRPTGRERPRT